MSNSDKVKYKLQNFYRHFQMVIEDLFQPFWDKKQPKHFLYQDFFNDDTCYKIIFGEEKNDKIINLHRIASSNLQKSFSITKISENIYYRGISFYRITFKGINLDHVCFHNCTFHFCKFINVTTAKVDSLSILPSYRQGFNSCNFFGSSFTDCNFEDTFWSMGELKCVTFENTKFFCSMFHRISFSQVCFSGNSELYHTSFLSPSANFDINFYDKDGRVKIDLDSRMTPFDYHDRININQDTGSRERYLIFKKIHYSKIPTTYYAFEQLCAVNHVLPQYENYYYERKPKLEVNHL